jgi:hypothetical protein
VTGAFETQADARVAACTTAQKYLCLENWEKYAREISSVERAFLFGVDSDYNVRDLNYVYLPDGHISVSLVCKDDGSASRTRGQKYPDVPLSRMVDRENDLLAWQRSIFYLLREVKKHAANCASLC